MADLEYHEMAWAERTIDFYGGDDGDQEVPAWHSAWEGDMDSEASTEVMQLDPSTFPPGTKIIIKAPVCPSCEEHRYDNSSHCHCGHDWSQFDEQWA